MAPVRDSGRSSIVHYCVRALVGDGRRERGKRQGVAGAGVADGEAAGQFGEAVPYPRYAEAGHVKTSAQDVKTTRDKASQWPPLNYHLYKVQLRPIISSRRTLPESFR